MNKTLYLIRHGQAYHNKAFAKFGSKVFYSPKLTDSFLTTDGISEAKYLNKSWRDIDKIDIVFTSPLYRACETTSYVFNDIDVPIYCLENLREYPIGEQYCNKRSTLNLLKKNFPNIDFTNIKYNEDIYWHDDYTENIKELNVRINEVLCYLSQIPEKNIAIVSHSSFIGQLKDNKISYLENGDIELKHCYPYKFKL